MSMARQMDALSPHLQRVIQAYVKRVSTHVGAVLEAVVLYGSAVRGEHLQGRSNLNMLLVMSSLTGETLRMVAPILDMWRKEQVQTLLLTPADLQSWSAQFPLEFSELIDDHVLLAGRDPLVGLRPQSDELHAAVVREIRGNVLRLRQRYVEGQATEESALIVIPLSITAIGACARGLARVWAMSTGSKTEAAFQAICQRLDLDPAPLLEAWALRCGQITPGQLEIPRLFDRYLTGLEHLAAVLSKEPVVLSR